MSENSFHYQLFIYRPYVIVVVVVLICRPVEVMTLTLLFGEYVRIDHR